MHKSTMPYVMPSRERLDEAARRLEAGELVAFPTETVYGLGADAENPKAVAKIYAAKGRPAGHPLIVHVVDGADLSYWADDVPGIALQLAEAFWPGPLTMILKRAPHIPAAVAGGQGSIGLRCPSHPVAQALLARFKRGRGGIAAPSANKFGQVSPTTAQHVREEFADMGDAVFVLEGDGVDVGIESTIIDLSRLDQGIGPVLLRPGAITPEDIERVTGQVPALPDAAAPRASGTLRAHYAPRTPLYLLRADPHDALPHTPTSCTRCCASSIAAGITPSGWKPCLTRPPGPLSTTACVAPPPRSNPASNSSAVCVHRTPVYLATLRLARRPVH
jgi:L-threonylcarbamoyladenylate synthase